MKCVISLVNGSIFNFLKLYGFEEERVISILAQNSISPYHLRNTIDQFFPSKREKEEMISDFDQTNM